MAAESFLAKYRTELKGLGALGVLAVHSLRIVPWPGSLEYVVNYGGLGVYIFMFLSGIGMYYSLVSRGEHFNVRDFYKRRFLAVFMPYLLIAGIWYGIKYLLIEGKPAAFLYEWLTISFWAEHKGAWYVATLVPIYLGYPFFFRSIERSARGIKTGIVLGLLFLGMGLLYRQFHPIYTHLSQVLNGLWVFVLGNYCAKRVRQGSNLPDLLLWFAGAFLLEKTRLLNAYFPMESILYAFKGILVGLVAASLLGLCKCRAVHSLLAWFGARSLELYLTNIFLIQALYYFGFDLWVGEPLGYLLYGMVVVLGAILSEGFLRLERRIRGGIRC